MSYPTISVEIDDKDEFQPEAPPLGRTSRSPGTIRRTLTALAVILTLAALAAGCGSGDSDSTASAETAGTTGTTATGGAGTAEATGRLRLGYFANVTHAPAVIGEEAGIFAEHLGDGVEIEYVYFNAGNEAIEALFSGAIDASFVGPNPAINGFAQSEGEALRIVAGSTSGGAALVVRDGIDSPADLEGATLATPSLGNTQDVALRAWLSEEGLGADTTGGGDVSIQPQANADTLTSFQTGAIDGAWVPEPWATRLVLEGGGHVLVDERDLWPGGQFVTTHLFVATDYLAENPAVVRGLVEGLLEAIEVAGGDPAEAQRLTNAGIERITTRALPADTIAGAWEKLSFTPDPIASSLVQSAEDAVEVGLLEPVELDGIYDLTILNELLAERGQPEVEGL
jgi:NitT/TauT family transport system substrate-binding protein